MSRKAAIELSMDFLVVTIIAVVVLVMGIYLAVNIYENVEKTRHALNEQIQQEIDDLLDKGEIVAVPRASISIAKGESASFGIGVRNSEDADLNFRIVIDNTEIIDGCDSSKLKIALYREDGVLQTKPMKIASKDRSSFAIGVIVPKTVLSCQYVLYARVESCLLADMSCVNPSSYGIAQKLYVTVTS